jgi:ADP-ribose pyrophosphatase YjhB (NUDIX family)
MCMRGYTKGTTAAEEMRGMREAFTRAIAAIQASPDAEQAFRDASALSELTTQLRSETADFRGYLAARLADSNALSVGQLSQLLGMSRSRAAQLIALGRRQENPVTDPGTEPEPASVALAIITSDQGVLIARRNDRIPPWTFPGGEILPGESPAAAVQRKAPDETGLEVSTSQVIGRRIHPKTGRVIIYVQAEAKATDAHVGDPDDLAEVKWASLAEVDQLMPDMFPTVRQHLGRVLAE